MNVLSLVQPWDSAAMPAWVIRSHHDTFTLVNCNNIIIMVIMVIIISHYPWTAMPDGSE